VARAAAVRLGQAVALPAPVAALADPVAPALPVALRGAWLIRWRVSARVA